MDEVIVDATTPTTLVFFHGASFCKEVWQPVIDVLRRYLPRDVEFRTFDMPYHGSAHDEHAVSEARVDPTNATSPRVHHPRINNWVELATEAVQHHAASLMEEMSFTRQRRRLIGIGHSLGATGLWTTEMRRPGTFDRLVLFEPTMRPKNLEFRDKLADFLVGLTLRRPNT